MSFLIFLSHFLKYSNKVKYISKHTWAMVTVQLITPNPHGF